MQVEVEDIQFALQPKSFEKIVKNNHLVEEYSWVTFSLNRIDDDIKKIEIGDVEVNVYGV